MALLFIGCIGCTVAGYVAGKVYKHRNQPEKLTRIKKSLIDLSKGTLKTVGGILASVGKTNVHVPTKRTESSYEYNPNYSSSYQYKSNYSSPTYQYRSNSELYSRLPTWSWQSTHHGYQYVYSSRR